MIGRSIVLALAAMALAACGEKPQTASGIKTDTASFQGTGRPYTAPGWKPGEQVSWEQHLKVRTQRGQNEYAKTN